MNSAEPASKPDDPKFRILSLDGGGVRGYLSAKILEKMENYLNVRDKIPINIGERFDFIAGSSTGAIIALGLAMGKSAAEIALLYETLGKEVFGKSNRRSWLMQWFYPKYESQALQTHLEDFFGDNTLNDVKVHVCVTSVSLSDAKPRFYKSVYFNRNRGRSDEKLVDIAMASCAAPTFFKAHSMLEHSSNLIDGGIVANNPAMIAFVDAFKFEEIKEVRKIVGPFNETNLNKIILVSVGTGSQCSMPYEFDKLIDGGKRHWIIPISEVLFEAQTSLVDFQLKLLLENKPYLRINPALKFPMKLDDVEKMNELKNLADITSKEEGFLKLHF